MHFGSGSLLRQRRAHSSGFPSRQQLSLVVKLVKLVRTGSAAYSVGLGCVAGLSARKRGFRVHGHVQEGGTEKVPCLS